MRRKHTQGSVGRKARAHALQPLTSYQGRYVNVAAPFAVCIQFLQQQYVCIELFELGDDLSVLHACKVCVREGG